MKRLLMMTVASVAVTGTCAFAGGVERSSQSVSLMFEKGNYAEVSAGLVSPSVSGTFLGANSGNMTEQYLGFSFGIKKDMGNGFHLGLIVDQPVGADVAYPTGTGYPIAGSTGTISSTGVTGILRYQFPSNFSVYGGIRAISTSGKVRLLPSNYTMNTSTETDYGYLVGISYEKPEIALRVALTYNSEVDHDFAATENGVVSLPFTTTIPKSVNLEFQSGIAQNTLLFGSVRWVDWTSFDITPAGYAAANGGASLVDYSSDTTTYNLGIGRRFNERWSAAVSFGYEEASPGFSGNLGPTNGNKSIGIGATYTKDNVKITGGIRYVDIGDAQTILAAPPVPTTDFSGNSAIAVGIKVGFNF